MQRKDEDFGILEEVFLMLSGRIYVNSVEIRPFVLRQVLDANYTRHPCYRKAITTLMKQCIWPNVKDFIKCVVNCMEF